MSMNLKEIESMIKEALPDAIIEIKDLAGDWNHYSATITSSAFNCKSKIEININCKRISIKYIVLYLLL